MAYPAAAVQSSTLVTLPYVLVFVTLCLTFVLLFLSQKQIAAATQSPLSAQLRNVVLGYPRCQLSRVARLRTDVPNQLGQLWLAVDPVSLPGHSHSRFRTAVPGFCDALPRFRTAVPGFRAALPHFRTGAWLSCCSSLLSNGCS